MDAAKKGLAESGEIKAAAKGDLGVTTKDLNNDTNALGGLHQCVTKAEDFEPDIAQRSNMRLWQCSKLASCCSTKMSLPKAAHWNTPDSAGASWLTPCDEVAEATDWTWAGSVQQKPFSKLCRSNTGVG
jgi:hypothetical protein